MEFRVLGPLELAVDGCVVTTSSARRRRLLAALVASAPAGVPASRLVDAVWGPDPPVTARASLQSHVSRLRSLLREADDGPDRVVSHEDGYGLLLVDEDEVDAARFAADVERARSLLLPDPRAAADAATAALARWRGPPYAGAEEAVPDEVIRLESLRREAEALHVDAQLAAGDAGAVVDGLEARLALDPLDERAVGQLMLARLRTGRQAAALQAFQDARARLADELGVDPSPALQQRYEALLRQDPDLVGAAWRPSAPPAAGTAAPRAGGTTAARAATRHITALVGRDAAVAEVAGLVRAEALVTLTGPGGVGKTRLALAAAERAEDVDDVHVVPLAPVRRGDDLDAVTARACGVVPGPGAPLRSRLVDALARRRALLVVDSCEHLLPAVAELVGHLLARCPSLSVLTTSRERLGVPGERRWPVAPLRLPAAEETDPERLLHSPAVRVFCERARAADPGFVLTPGTARPVAALCRRMDGLPLALELAAARVATFGVAELARTAGAALDLLVTGPADEGGRHRSLRDVVAWSYSLLQPEQADLFDRLSVFAGDFAPEAVEGLVPGEDPAATRARLGALVDGSLVARTGARYHLLETLRLFGAERLRERGLDDEVRRRHAEQVAAQVELAAAGLRTDDSGWAARIAAGLDDVRAAHRWAVEHDEADLALRVSAPLGFYADLWLVDELGTWAETAARLPGAEGHPLLPVAWAAAARAAGNRGELARAAELAEAGVRAAGPDSTSAVLSVQALGLVALHEGRLPASDALLADALDLAARSGDRHQQACTWALRALVETYRSRPDAARAALGNADRYAASLPGSTHAHAWLDYVRGELLAATDPDGALAPLDAAVEGARRVGARLVEAVALVSRSTVRAERGDPVAALASFREAVERLRRAGDWIHQWTTLRNLVFLLARLGVDEPAAQLLAAVEAATTGPRTYGPDAERSRLVGDELRARLGPDAFEAACRRGRRQTDPEAVALALGTVDRLLAEGGGATGA